MTRPYGPHVAVLAKRSAEEQAESAIFASDGLAWPTDRSARRVLHWIEVQRDVVVAPLGGAIVAAVLAAPGERARAAALAWSVLVVGACLARRVAAQAALLPLMRHVFPLLGPALGAIIAQLVGLVTDAPVLAPLELLALAAAAAFLAQPWPGLFGARAPGTKRAAFIGPPAAAGRFANALAAGGSHQLSLVGRVSYATDGGGLEPASAVPALGPLDRLAAIVTENDIDLLVMGTEAPRLAVFSEVTDSCLGLPVRLVELSSLFEEVFGHVPVGEINAAWFQCLADPHARAAAAPLKRLIDVAGAAIALVLAAPLMPVLVLLIRRDGGPAIFTQVRIGAGGRRFRLHKLRTMHIGADSSAQWASPEDPRITRVGRFLRRTHLDELPQLVNVLRGDMSLVGPRPEQPAFVDRLEQALPFYQRRHLIRPGITGWAQIRCGYAGSDIGSAWKLCHDLYYAKHRSTAVDMLILGETLATMLFDREPVLQPENVALVLSDER
jgi:exopolysaccharide biosynthesis polyprenyl glycosylphosphotransferase